MAKSNAPNYRKATTDEKCGNCKAWDSSATSDPMTGYCKWYDFMCRADHTCDAWAADEFAKAWALVKMPISFDQHEGAISPNQRYLYSGGHSDDDFRYFSSSPATALGIALFGSAIPRKWFPDDYEGTKMRLVPKMRETVPKMRVLDTQMVDDDIELYGSPHEAIIPSRAISQHLEEMGALSDVPQSHIEENLRQIIDSERFNRERYKKIRETGTDEWGDELDDEEQKWFRDHIPFSWAWWHMNNPDDPQELHPVFERLGMEWDPRTLDNEMWWPLTENTSAGFSESRKDILDHVKGALNRLQTGKPGVVELPPNERQFYGIAENDDRPNLENILEGWN